MKAKVMVKRKKTSGEQAEIGADTTSKKKSGGFLIESEREWGEKQEEIKKREEKEELGCLVIVGIICIVVGILLIRSCIR